MAPASTSRSPTPNRTRILLLSRLLFGEAADKSDQVGDFRLTQAFCGRHFPLALGNHSSNLRICQVLDRFRPIVRDGAERLGHRRMAGGIRAMAHRAPLLERRLSLRCVSGISGQRARSNREARASNPGRHKTSSPASARIPARSLLTPCGSGGFNPRGNSHVGASLAHLADAKLFDDAQDRGCRNIIKRVLVLLFQPFAQIFGGDVARLAIR